MELKANSKLATQYKTFNNCVGKLKKTAIKLSIESHILLDFMNYSVKYLSVSIYRCNFICYS